MVQEPPEVAHLVKAILAVVILAAHRHIKAEAGAAQARLALPQMEVTVPHHLSQGHQ